VPSCSMAPGRTTYSDQEAMPLTRAPLHTEVAISVTHREVRCERVSKIGLRTREAKERKGMERVGRGNNVLLPLLRLAGDNLTEEDTRHRISLVRVRTVAAQRNKVSKPRQRNEDEREKRSTHALSATKPFWIHVLCAGSAEKYLVLTSTSPSLRLGRGCSTSVKVEGRILSSGFSATIQALVVVGTLIVLLLGREMRHGR
jgi:hypothetical protein